MSKQFYFKQFRLISPQFSSILPLDKTLSAATTPDQSGPGSDGNEGVLRIPQSSSITGTSPSDCLVSYPGHWLRGSYPTAEKKSVYSKSPRWQGKGWLEFEFAYFEAAHQHFSHDARRSHF